MALIFGFHFLFLSLLLPPPNYIADVGRPERSLLLEGFSLLRGQGWLAGGVEVLGPEVEGSSCKGSRRSSPPPRTVPGVAAVLP